MNAELIETLSVTLVITSVAAMELRRLNWAAIAYACQALLIVGLLLSFAAVNSALYWWAMTAFVTKAVLIPWFLFRAIAPGDKVELKDSVKFKKSEGDSSKTGSNSRRR